MAARTNKITHDDKTKRLIQASQLLNRLTAHANGEIELTATQINAAKIVIGKYIPDLKAMEITGEGGGPLKIEIIKFADS
jgi:ribosomal protein L16/L10AE